MTPPYLKRPQDGAGGVHEEEAQIAQDVGKGEQALGYQDGMESIPVFPFGIFDVLELRRKENILKCFSSLPSVEQWSRLAFASAYRGIKARPDFVQADSVACFPRDMNEGAGAVGNCETNASCPRAYLAVSNYLEGESSQVKGIHHKAQLVPRLVQEVFQPLVPKTLHVRPHHSCRTQNIFG